jgi:hypothetical protein
MEPASPTGEVTSRPRRQPSIDNSSTRSTAGGEGQVLFPFPVGSKGEEEGED